MSYDLTIRNVLALDAPGGLSLGPLVEEIRACVGDHCVVHQVASEAEFLSSLGSGFPYQLALVELEHGDGKRSGSEIMPALRRIDPEVPVLAISNRENLASARRAVTAGASDYLVMDDHLQDRVETLLVKLNALARALEEKHDLAEENLRLASEERSRNQILGRSAEIAGLLEQISRVASVPRPLLVVGERGTGKELVAREIHTVGGDPGRPFVAVNCAAFPDQLLESELFGHEKGAFTGAAERRRGRFELASDGTLFLDEIGFMSLPFQQKILRVVEYGAFRRVGGNEEVRTTARIIAATNVDLASRMQAGRFLRDLYDRLAFEVIRVPPLRVRKGDVALLAREFLLRFMREIPVFQGKTLSDGAIRALERYDFPGNVRELKNLIERAAYKDTNNEIVAEDIDLPVAPRAVGGTFHERVESLKSSLIQQALKRSGGNQAEAARRLGLSYDQFRHYFRKYARPEPHAAP